MKVTVTVLKIVLKIIVFVLSVTVITLIEGTVTTDCAVTRTSREATSRASRVAIFSRVLYFERKSHQFSSLAPEERESIFGLAEVLKNRKRSGSFLTFIALSELKEATVH